MWSNPFIVVPLATLATVIILVRMWLHHLSSNQVGDSSVQIDAPFFNLNLEVHDTSLFEERVASIQQQQAIDFSSIQQQQAIDNATNRLLWSINNVIRALPKHIRPSLRSSLASIDTTGTSHEVVSRLAPLVARLIQLAAQNRITVPGTFHAIASEDIYRRIELPSGQSLPVRMSLSNDYDLLTGLSFTDAIVGG